MSLLCCEQWQDIAFEVHISFALSTRKRRFDGATSKLGISRGTRRARRKLRWSQAQDNQLLFELGELLAIIRIRWVFTRVANGLAVDWNFDYERKMQAEHSNLASTSFWTNLKPQLISRDCNSRRPRVNYCFQPIFSFILMSAINPNNYINSFTRVYGWFREINA